jgi:hypothetical protein
MPDGPAANSEDEPMRYNMISKQLQKRRQEWMATFESEIIGRLPRLAGKIDFENTGTYFFNSGLSAQDAAERYVSNIPSKLEG